MSTCSALALAIAVVFEAGATQLPQAEIRAAIAQELGAPLLERAEPGKSTLSIDLDDQQHVVLRFVDGGVPVERRMPWTADAGAVEAVALMAQNLVRDQTSDLLAAPPPELPERTDAFQTHLSLQLALWSDVRVHPELPRSDARSNIGLAVRVEGPAVRHLAVGASVVLSHWEGSAEEQTLLVSPADFMDFVLFARPRLPLADAELYLVLAAGPSLMSDLEVEQARPPELGLTASTRAGALYWLSSSVGVLLELGVEYHRARSTERDGRQLALDLIQPAASLGAAFAFR